MKKVIIFVVFAAFILSASFAFAAKPVKMPNVKTKENIQKQETAVLKQQIKDLKIERKSVVKNFKTTLKQGAKGSEVKNIQTILALDPTIYPEGQTDGALGPKTKKAIMKFQAKNGLTADGIVGIKTKLALEEELEENDLLIEDGKVCSIIPPGHLIAPGWLKNNGGVAPTIPTCQNLPAGIAKKLGIPTPVVVDEVKPEITVGEYTDLTATSVKISWTTSEVAKSKIWYGTTTPLDIAVLTTPKVEDNNLLTTHGMTLVGLNPETTYYFIVGAVDAAGNTKESDEMSFKTLVTTVVDTTDPVITGIVSNNITNTGAEIAWVTDESSTSKVFYSLADIADVTTSSVYNLSSSSLLTNHSLVLNGLEANKTYYYKVESVDAAGNEATSPQGSFMTTNTTSL